MTSEPVIREVDLYYRDFRNLTNGILGLMGGLFGTAFVLAAFNLSNTTWTVSTTWTAGTILGIIGAGRDLVLKKVVIGTKFTKAWRFQTINRVGCTIGLAALVSSSSWFILTLWLSIPTISIILVFTIGLSYLIVPFCFNWIFLFADSGEGRLSLLQFLATTISDKLPNYSWLHRGLRRVEQKLRKFGISLPKGGLFLGLSYSMFKGELPDSKIEALIEWLGNEGSWIPQTTVQTILHQYLRAERLGMKPSPTLGDYLSNLPWQKIALAIQIVVGLIAVLGALFELHIK